MSLSDLEDLQETTAEYQQAVDNIISTILSRLSSDNQDLQTSFALLSSQVDSLVEEVASLNEENGFFKEEIQELRSIDLDQDRVIGDLSRQLNPAGSLALVCFRFFDTLGQELYSKASLSAKKSIVLCEGEGECRLSSPSPIGLTLVSEFSASLFDPVILRLDPFNSPPPSSLDAGGDSPLPVVSSSPFNPFLPRPSHRRRPKSSR